jgi:hypothetical protein
LEKQTVPEALMVTRSLREMVKPVSVQAWSPGTRTIFCSTLGGLGAGANAGDMSRAASARKKNRYEIRLIEFPPYTGLISWLVSG